MFPFRSCLLKVIWSTKVWAILIHDFKFTHKLRSIDTRLYLYYLVGRFKLFKNRLKFERGFGVLFPGSSILVELSSSCSCGLTYRNSANSVNVPKIIKLLFSGSHHSKESPVPAQPGVESSEVQGWTVRVNLGFFSTTTQLRRACEKVYKPNFDELLFRRKRRRLTSLPDLFQ